MEVFFLEVYFLDAFSISKQRRVTINGWVLS